MPLPPGLVRFLSEQPDMRVVPGGAKARLQGTYALDATHSVAGHVTREYQLGIDLPPNFPAQLPVVFELGGCIPRDSDFHVNVYDGSLCLGSPLALRRIARQKPDLQAYF